MTGAPSAPSRVKVSIVVPVFNAASTLRRCVDSILAQTHDNLEVVLVDDGSQDGSWPICQAYAAADDRVRTVHQSNGGVSSARNAGLRIAQGDYIGFVDPDDYLDPGMYEVMLRTMGATSCSVAVLDGFTVRTSTNAVAPKVSAPSISARDAMRAILLLRHPTSVWAYLYARGILKGLLFDERIHFFEDLQFNLSVLGSVECVAICGEPGLYVHTVSQLGANLRSLDERFFSVFLLNYVLRSDLEQRAPDLLDALAYFEAHCVVVGMYRAAIDDRQSQPVYGRIQTEARAILRDTWRASEVPFHYKCIILSASIAPRLVGRVIRSVRSLPSFGRGMLLSRVNRVSQ